MPTEVLKNAARLITSYKHLRDAHYKPSSLALLGYLFAKGCQFLLCPFSPSGPFPDHCGSASLQGPTSGLASRQPATVLPRGRLRRATPRSLRAGGGGSPEKGKLQGEKGQTLKLPGCGLRARMLSVLSTSWQQNLGLGRRRCCGNGAPRVAEPAFAPARSPREALPSVPSAP